MLKRRVELLPEQLYPADEWRLVQARYSDEFRVPSRRIVSLEHRHLVAMTYEVTMLDELAPVVVSSLVLNCQDASRTGQVPERRPGDSRLATMLPHRVLHMRAAAPAQPRDRGRDQAAATMTGTLRAIIGFQRPCPSSAQARASRQRSPVVRALERPVA